MRWRLTLGHLYVLILMVCVLLVPTVAMADPLDDLGTKLGSFITRAGLIAAALIIPSGGGAITVLAIRRQMAKAMGDDEVMSRAGNQISDVIKLTAIGTGASLLTSVAGSILA